MQENETATLQNLPTGKQHVSFSELRDWQECSYRHKLRNIDKIEVFEPSPILDFGTAVHSSCENYLKTRVMDTEIALAKIMKAFEENAGKAGYEEKLLEPFLKEAAGILEEVPKFLDDNFQEWECIDAEHFLYESLEKYPHAFKGFIDGIIKTKGKKGEDLYWILDWKTTSWGWNNEKKSNPDIARQLVFYKNFWSKKKGINPKNIRCGFVLLKRTGKPGSRCELVTVSVGDVTTERSLKLLNNMISSVKRGVALKNKNSCTYCPFKNTPHCT
jgi:hypothetical protein